jgi:hypothetical protein
MPTEPDDARERRPGALADSTYDEMLRLERERIAERLRLGDSPRSELLTHPSARIIALVHALKAKLGSHRAAIAEAKAGERFKADAQLISNVTRLGREKESKRDKKLREQVERLGWTLLKDIKRERDFQEWMSKRWGDLRDVLGIVPGQAGRPRSPLFADESERAARAASWFESFVNARGPACAGERRRELNEMLSKRWSLRYHDIASMTFEGLGAHEAAYGSAPDKPVHETYRKLSQRFAADRARKDRRD